MVAAGQFFGFVFADDQAQALRTHRMDQTEDFGTAFGVKVGGRFVKHDYRRAQGEHGSDCETLLLAAGKGRGIAVVEAVQPDRIQRRADACANFGWR